MALRGCGTLSSVAPWCASCFTTRAGGVSTDAFAALNLGLHVGDDAEAVIENRTRAAADLGFSLRDMVCAEQIHGGEAAVVDAAYRGRGATSFDDTVRGVDALITAAPGVLLTLFFADCIPVLLADTRNHAIAVAHAGWRGILAGVIENTVAAMRREFESHPRDIVASVGPGIGVCCFEAGPDVAGEFPSDSVTLPGDRRRAFVDLKAAVARRLIDAGVVRESLSVDPACTACRAEEFFSYRRDTGRTGRMAALIGIIP